MRPDRWLVIWLLVLAGATAVASLGGALVGSEVFLATDQLLNFEPWRSELPAGLVTSVGPYGDTFDIWDPQRQLFADALWNGDLALWNPFPSGGAPLAAEPSTGAFGVFELPYVLLPDWYAPGAERLLEMGAAIGFTALLLRRLGTGWAAGLIGGLVYALSGFQLVWANWPQSRVGALIPLLWWATERYRQLRTVRSLTVVAVALAAMLFEGFPAVTAFAVAVAGSHLVVALVADTRRGRSTSSDAARAIAGFGAAVALGVGLAAVQLLPFLERLGTLDLQRDQTPENHLSPTTALTAAVPNALGDPSRFFGRDNYIEVQSYVGVAALALAAVALLWRGHRRAGIAAGFAACAAVLVGGLMYLGGAPLGLLQNLSVFDTNPIGRARSVLGLLLAVLAGLGAHALLAERASRRRRRTGAIVLAAGGLLIGVGLLVDRVVAGAAAAGHRGYVVGQLGEAGGLAVVAVAVIAFGARTPRWRHAAVGAVALLVAYQGGALAHRVLPSPDRSLWYPSTSTHEFLEDEVDHERIAPAGLTLMPGSSARWELRTVTGHVFTQPAWEEALLAVDPTAFDRSPTLSVLSPSAEVAGSPVLDRLGAGWYTQSDELPPLGTLREPPTGRGSLAIRSGEPGLRGRLEAAPGLRAVVLRIVDLPVAAGESTRLRTQVRDGDGEVVATGTRRVHGPVADALVHISVAGLDDPTTAPSGPLEVEVVLDGPPGAVGRVAAADGLLALGDISGDDELRLRHTGGAQSYERLTALPRIRWASAAVVEADPAARLELLRAGVQDDTVVLSSGTPRRGSGVGDVAIVDDDLDEIVVRVDASADGWLVVADAIQDGWTATVDGEPAELTDADHAVVAVAVPRGDHVVRLAYASGAWELGSTVSAISALGAGLLITGGDRLVQRRRRPASRRLRGSTASQRLRGSTARGQGDESAMTADRSSRNGHASGMAGGAGGAGRMA